jgi:cytochrome P450
MWPTVFLNHPDYLKHILQDQYQFYDKDVASFEIARSFAGNGLITAVGGKTWLSQRRLIQPAFHKERIAAFASTMTAAALARAQSWEAHARSGEAIDVAAEMQQLSLFILGKTLFNADLSERSNAIRSAFDAINTFVMGYYHLPFPPLNVPTRRNLRYKEVLRDLDAAIYALIEQRRASGDPGTDFLGMLLAARDEETGKGMSDLQLRDEMVTFLFAGSETSALGLAWAWYLLARHPDVEAELHAELERVLAGRVPTFEDLPQLIYTRQVIDEVLRLYPPSWFLMRRAVRDDEIGGYAIQRNSFILWSAYLLHRHPEVWDEPEQFRPGRFLPEQIEKRPRYAYIPFGGGPRLCMGNNFALMEMTLVLATIAQRYRLELTSPREIEPEPLIVLPPRNGVPVFVRPRDRNV